MFPELLLLSPNPIYGIMTKFYNDMRKNKINLTVGEIFFYENGKKNLFDFNFIMSKLGIHHDKYFSKTSKYLPILGCSEFIINCEKFIFGNNRKRTGCQTISGTGSLMLGNYLLELINQKIYIQKKSWPNHFGIFKIHKLYKSINDLKKIYNSTILFHTCCHNPTGIDFTNNEWKIICKIMIKNNNIAYFDTAYLGISSGDPKKDSYPIRFFEDNGIPIIISMSFSKTFGLYGQRTGCLFFNFFDLYKETIYIQYIQRKIRQSYSNPPRMGAEMANCLMTNPTYLRKWRETIKYILKYQIEIRNILYKKLYWNISDKKGLFFISPLTKKQIIELRDKHAIYMLENGRINISGLNKSNIKYFIKCVKQVEDSNSNLLSK